MTEGINELWLMKADLKDDLGNIKKLMKQNYQAGQISKKKYSDLESEIFEKYKEIKYFKWKNDVLYEEWLKITSTIKLLPKENEDYISFCSIFLLYGYCVRKLCPHLHKDRQWIDKYQPECLHKNSCVWGNVCKFSHTQ